MNSVSLFLSDILAHDSPEQKAERTESLSSFLSDEFRESSWCPSQHTEWCERICREAAILTSDKVIELKNKNVSQNVFNKILSDISANPLSTLFLTPLAIHTIYSKHSPEFDAFVNEGANYHCRLIRRAVSQVVRRHLSGMKRASIEAQELEDELFGIVMEELVRCLSDPSARIWTQESAESQEFPPAGMRGMRRGMMTRTSLSKEGNQLATIRSDRQLFLWDLTANELLRRWDLNALNFEENGRICFVCEKLFFSTTSSHLAVETQENKIYVFSLMDDDSTIQQFDESSQNDFFLTFGEPYLPNRPLPDDTIFRVHTRVGHEVPFQQYCKLIYDWNWNPQYKKAATASEIDRVMPEWMRKAGFERAVFHITKKRLIDLIRKRTHTNYACWQCGSMSAGYTDTHCRCCGADFTRCPLGCDMDETLGIENHWQCRQCGMTSRTAVAAVEVEVEDWIAAPSAPESEWRDSHDMERILNVVQHVSVAYKKKEIACDKLILLKSEGKTNEEIGLELDIPRGSVDYVWNQCKHQIILAFGGN